MVCHQVKWVDQAVDQPLLKCTPLNMPKKFKNKLAVSLSKFIPNNNNNSKLTLRQSQQARQQSKLNQCCVIK